MPARLIAKGAAHERPRTAYWLSGAGTAGLRDHSAWRISIGLINNMPDGALESTERQFLSLLDAASGKVEIRLSLYSLPGVQRKGAAANHVRMFYSDMESLWGAHLDGLIVTGREPLAPSLPEESYWGDFTRVVDWARENTYSTVWSCLAAHAAALYCDGIGRVRSRNKHSGVFRCSQVEDHPLMAGVTPHMQLPHSRWNGIEEAELRGRGYHVLTRSEAGVDMFVKEYESLFVFFQGHPEYDANTLLLEYRRDVGRYFRGESRSYPTIPENYFPQEAADMLQAFHAEAARNPRPELVAEIYGMLQQVSAESSWHADARCIYGNWVESIVARKQARMSKRPMTMRAGAEPALIAMPYGNAPLSRIALTERTSAREKPRRAAAGR